MNSELSLFERHRIALSFQGPLSEDPEINSIASVQRLVSQVAQGILIGGIVGYAGWIYNDPERQNGEDLPWTLFAVGGTGLAAIGSVTSYRIYRWCRNTKDYESWIADPILVISIASVAPLIAHAIAYEKAKKIEKAISALNIKNGELVNEEMELLWAQQDQCYREVFERREEFTEKPCSVCVTSNNQSRYPSFYQARPVAEFSALLCNVDMSKVKSFSIDTLPDEWPCMNSYFYNYSDPDYRWKSSVARTLGIQPPLEVKVIEPVNNESCFWVNASGTEIQMLALSLCAAPDLFDPNKRTICATSHWNEFALNYSASGDWVNPKYTHLVVSDQVNRLLYGDSVKMNWGTFGPVLLLSLLALFAKVFGKNCKKSKPTPPVEMETLTLDNQA